MNLLEEQDSAQQQIIDAAIICFQKFGIQKTTMNDIANEAGLSRQTVYRNFSSRSQLLEQVAELRIAQMAEKLYPLFAKYNDLATALVDGSIRSIAVSRKDRLFMDLVNQVGDHEFELFLFRGSDRIMAIMARLWGPLLSAARRSGQIRSNLEDSEIVEWIVNVHAMLQLRSDYSNSKQRKILENFLVPSILNGQTTA